MELAPRWRPQWSRRRVTAQGPVLSGWVGGVPGILLSLPGWRLQGTQGALNTHLEMHGARSRQGTEPTQPAPGLLQKSRLEKCFIVAKKKMKRNCFFGGGGGSGNGGSLQKGCCRWCGAFRTRPGLYFHHKRRCSKHLCCKHFCRKHFYCVTNQP